MVKMGTVWDRTAEFLSDNIGTLLPIALLAYFVPASIEGNFSAAMAGANTGLILSLRLLQVLFGVLSLWGSLAIVAMALDMPSDDSPGQIAGRRLPAAIAVSLAMIVAALLAALPIAIVLMASGHDMMAIARGEHLDLGASISAFIAIYLIALVIALVWISSRLILTTPVIVREKRMFSAIPQSWMLTRGTTLRIVGVLLLYALVSWVAQLAANTVFGSIFTLVVGADGDGVTLAGVLTSIVVAAVQTGFMVIMPAFTAKLYLALTAEVGLRSTAAAAQ